MCDAVIDADARNCPSCLTDLSLFDVGGGAEGDSADVRASESKSIDDILASIMEGKSEQPEIFETLKSVASSHPSTKDLVDAKPAAAPPPPEPAPAAEPPEHQFLCPVCDTPVSPDDKVCPGCGAEFSEGEATEYECPVCKAGVPADADHCPSCGVRFASEEEAAAEPPALAAPAASTRPAQAPATSPPAAAARPAPEPSAAPAGPASLRNGPKVEALKEEVRTETHDLPFGDRKLIARELPKLVNEVKPLLVSAKNIGVGIEEGKRLINGAVEAGKRKEMEDAVKLITDARRALDLAFVAFIGGRLQTLASEVEAAGAGEAAVLSRPHLEEALAELSKRDYEAAWASLQKAKYAFQSQAKEYTEGRKILEATEHLMADVRSLGMDPKDVQRLVNESREAAQHRDLPNSLRLAKRAQERLLESVPEFVQSEMREARDRLLDLKMGGGDLSKPVGILKEASGHVKNQEWSEAIRFLKEFQKEVSRTSKG